MSFKKLAQRPWSPCSPRRGRRRSSLLVKAAEDASATVDNLAASVSLAGDLSGAAGG